MSLPLCKFASADGAAKVLEFNTVFITSPLDLNDPFEMRPAWTNTHELEQFEERQIRDRLTGGIFGAEPPITGRTGSGKTQCAINAITFQIFQNLKNWGGVCLDQKGLYWEILVRMAAHFGRSDDLVLLQTRPPGEDMLWRPPHTINITGNPDVPASTYAKVIVDTAVSLTGGRGGNPFFPTKAQLAIQTAFEILRHIEAYVTIPNVHRLLLVPEDSNAALEELLDAARITLADHRAYDLTGFYIVCTSNIGSQQLLRPTRLPFATLERAVLAELHRFFRPELVGRFDEKIVFKPLSPDTQREIGQLVISEELARFRQQGINLAISEPAFEFLVRRGIHKALGARPMKHIVQKFIGDAIRHSLKARQTPTGTLALSSLSDSLTIQTAL